jgi:RimJ/RimL family protein N-acetyltransferase
MKLVDVYSDLTAAEPLLWQLLTERTPEQSISHKTMPIWKDHVAFIASKPYAYWYLLDAGEQDYVGAAYLTRQREIGIGILRRYHGFQYGRSAVRLLMDRHPGRFLANINPQNGTSIQMFRELGFRQIQVTYEREPS